jgi:hypothetical protein
MVDYKFAKIYKIVPTIEHNEGDEYFGSTTQEKLSDRFDGHKWNYKQWKNGKYAKVTVYDRNIYLSAKTGSESVFLLTTLLKIKVYF